MAKSDLKRVSSLRYSLGMLGLSIPSQAFTVFLIFFYVDNLGLAVGLAAIGRSIFAVWDAVNNILFGYLSDNTRSRWGRRRPWLISAIPFYLLLFIMVYTVPDIFLDGRKLFWYFTIIIFLYETAATILWGNYNALFPEVFKKTASRAKTSAFKQLFGIIGMVIGIAVTPLVYNQFGFAGMAIIYGIIGSIILLYSILGSHEDPNSLLQPVMPFLEAFKVTLTNKPFWHYSLAYTFIQFVFGLLMAGIPFYAQYTLGLDTGKTSILLASVFAVALPMVFIWAKLIKKWGATKTWLIGVAVLAITVVPLGLANNMTTGIIAGAILGLGYCGVLVSGEVVTSEIIDRDADQTGVRREAIYLSVYGFIIRISGILQSLAFVLIGILFGYVSGDQPGPQPDTAFRFFMSVIPFVALTIAFVIGMIYKKSSSIYQKNSEETVNG